MKMQYKTFQERFEVFKNITAEEKVIASITKGLTSFKENNTLLDVGGGAGNITKLIQPNSSLARIVDIENYGHAYPFSQGKWEDVCLDNKYDVVLMSHVYGKFERAGTLEYAFKKGLDHANSYLVMCYNQSSGKLADLLYDLSEKIPEGLIDFFDENLLPENRVEVPFSVQLATNSLDELTEQVQVLFELPDEVFNQYKGVIRKSVGKYCSDPVLEVQQKVVGIKK